MSRLIIALFLAALCSLTTAADSKIKAEDVGAPVYLTKYINCGKVQVARQKAEVRYDGFKNIKSYSGFITVNKTYNSNTFFWFVLSQTNPSQDPVILYSDGGPGSSALSVLFNYNGPFIVTKDQKLSYRNDSLTKNHNVIYVDNPIGAGFSFTDNNLGYARTQDDIGRHILSFLEQFYKMFPEFRRNDLYSAGDSYAARFSVTMSRVIRDYNRNAKEKVNLKGLILGNAFIDLAKQQFDSNFLYYIGLLDYNERNQMKEIDERISKLDESDPKYVAEVGAKYLLINNFTGYTYIHNYLSPSSPEDVSYFSAWIQTPELRRVLHVGDRTFVAYSLVAGQYFAADINRPVTSVLERALVDYRLLSYTGQLDIHFPYAATEELYRSLKWSGAEEYKKVKKEKWYYQGELAGYRKKVGNFEEAIVRNAGHIADYEQPAWVCDLITDFTHRK